MNKIRLIYTTKNLHYEIHLKTSYFGFPGFEPGCSQLIC